MSGSAADAGRLKRAAEAHFAAMVDLDRSGHQVLTIYVAGLAIEALFRAYIYRLQRTVSKAHGLRELAEDGEFFKGVPPGRRPEVAAALGEIASRWYNLLRYESVDSVEKEYRRRGLDRLANGRLVKGDLVAYNREIVVESALIVANEGLGRWQFSKP